MSKVASLKGQGSRLPALAEREKRRRLRAFKDRLSRVCITTAGYGVVFSLALIFIYLLYEVVPILKGARLETLAVYNLLGSEQIKPAAISLEALSYKETERMGSEPTLAHTEHLVLERYQELAVHFANQGQIHFFKAETGDVQAEFQLDFSLGQRATSFAAAESLGGLVAYGTSAGGVHFVRPHYQVSFPNDQRHLTPSIQFPYGEQAIQLDRAGSAIRQLAVQESTRGRPEAFAVGYTADQRWVAAHIKTRENLLTGVLSTQVQQNELTAITQLQLSPNFILLDKQFQNLFVAAGNRIYYFNISNIQEPKLVEQVQLKSTITAMEFLVGAVSVVVGTETGELSQWFPVRDAQNNYHFEHIRDFKQQPGAITKIAPEYTRKGFLAADSKGYVGVHYGTSARTLLIKQMASTPLTQLAISPVNRALMSLSEQGQLTYASVWNQHPQLSFSALWNKVWYEGRADPEYIWQSSSGNDEFESKFSFIPLSIGTLKAAFFAMLFAMPMGILAAVYTAYFMTPKLRGVVKPTIEVIEALPTVILGFLAGLWLAPFMENNLPAVFSLLLGLPLMMLVVSLLWRWLFSYAPKQWQQKLAGGWEAIILLPFVALFTWFAVTASPWFEVVFFDGSMRQWLTNAGITYDQRNALVVGLAMGFAVIPTIYSIAEDAIFNVPRHLTQGSLALGATQWQTMMGVVLPTASPGIFSGLMIGFGRAVGETMIVLMATGNSPIVNFNLFEGMRTLSANIAVELPETAVGSSHFRILFLAALVLFVFTFILNTLAEVVRQRLRKRYSSL